jgi:hypothetical protein
MPSYIVLIIMFLLFKASLKGFNDVVKVLIDNNANINDTDDSWYTPKSIGIIYLRNRFFFKNNYYYNLF